MTTITATDTGLQRAVLAELVWEPSVDASHIGVSVKNGVVTLSGHVESYLEKLQAERAAKRVPGVRGVANELEIKLPDSNKRSDEDIALAAVNALKWNLFVPADQIKITVRQGWITLEGEVKWQFQRNAAEKAVRRLKGVMGVNNYIRIQPRITPIEVQNRITDAFTRSAELDARGIKVEADGDKVILVGRVRSLAEREEAERIAWSAPGVSQVENLIVVEP